MKYRLSANNLVKRFGWREVVSAVSFSVESSQIVGLLGPNGAGKTTSFYIVMGFIRPEGGTITLNDREITHLPMHVRAKKGVTYLPQEPSVFRKLSVFQNVLAVLENQPIARKARFSRAEEILEDLNIAHLRNYKAYKLSGGERRRVEIARALASNPAFMLLDEPFAGIDPIAVSNLKAIICRLKEEKKMGILITDHNVRETLSICDHAYLIQDGKVVVQGSAYELVQNSRARQIYLGADFQL